MNTRIKALLLLALITAGAFALYKLIINVNPNPKRYYGQKLDSLDGVYVYYNGMIEHTQGRNRSADGYNIGLKYQCVEFVKRYYYEHFRHKMPDTYGHAKDFFDPDIPDGSMNPKRGLLQCSNPSEYKPEVGDLLVFDGHSGNPYGHVAIVSGTTENSIEYIQQNPGPFGDSRALVELRYAEGKFELVSGRLLGWLRMKQLKTEVTPIKNK